MLTEEFPLGYYTRLARELLASGKPTLAFVDPRKGRSQPLLAVYPTIQDLTVGGAEGRPAGYLRLGLNGATREVLDAKHRSGLPWARLAYWAEDFHGAVRAAGQSWLDWPKVGDPEPLSLPGLAYPVAYPRSAAGAAREAGIHPHLLLAVAHTESHFDADAYSPWEARGLMQFIPSTGSVVAKAAGVDGFEVEDLYQPRIALRLGARHLRELLDRFDGDLVAAVAAYNAGAGAVGRWRQRWGKRELDLNVESIPYRETRRYVKKVITAIDAYGRLDPPGLWVQQPP
jgi:soluble lytic murein transglycosylase